MSNLNEKIKQIQKANIVFVCGLSTGLNFSVSKALAKTIVRKGEYSNVKIEGENTVTIYI